MHDVATHLRDRLLVDDDPLRILITDPSTNPDTDAAASAFLKQNKPNALLWLGSQINNATLTKCMAAKLPIGLANMTTDDLSGFQRRGLFRRRRPDQIEFVMSRDDGASAILTKAGVDAKRIEHSDTLTPDLKILPYDEDELFDFANKLGTRPVWLAAGARLSDVPHLVAAHRKAARAAHRIMMLVATPDDPDEMVKALTGAGLNVGSQTDSDDPHIAIEAYVMEAMDELGLALRIATIGYICGTFTDGAAIDPYAAASLGCAVIAGPRQAEFADNFQSLFQAGALLTIASPDDLGDTVMSLLSVDRTAKMAHAGWEVTTKGIDVLDRLEVLTRTHLLRM